MTRRIEAPLELKGVLTLADAVADHWSELLHAYLLDNSNIENGDEPPSSERLPELVVTLTFAERSDQSPARLKSKLKVLFFNILPYISTNAATAAAAVTGAGTAASTGASAAGAAIGGPIGAGLGLMASALFSYRKANPADSTATEIAELFKRLDESKKAEFLNLSKGKTETFLSWLREVNISAKPRWLSQRNWQEFVEHLFGSTEIASEPQSDAKADHDSAGQMGDKPKVEVPVTTPTSTSEEAFQLVQLTGWLQQDEGGKFNIAIYSNYDIRDREIAPGGRLDILGPDGSQLYTQLATPEEVKSWLDGSEDIEIDWNEASDLQRIVEQTRQRQVEERRYEIVRGRLWRSDGAPLGITKFAVFAPPDFASPLSDCCLEEALEATEPGCCCDDEKVFPFTIRAPQAIAIAETDEAGYFEFSYQKPEDGLKSKYALLELAGGRATLAATLEQTGEGTYKFPKTLLLPLGSDVLPQESANDVRPFSDDSSCCGTRFGEANRALEEFDFNLFIRTSDPAINRPGLQNNPNPTPDLFFRTAVSREEPVQWNGNDLLSQAQTIAHGRILTIRQSWMADGYSLGDLLYSLPLAPLQKKNIAVVDWDRHESVSLESQQTNVESLSAYMSRDRDISEIVNSSFNENIRARSDSGSRAGSRSSGLFGSVFGGSSGGGATAWSTSSQDVVRTLTSNFLNQLRDRTNQSANNFRSQRVTTVQQVNQSEQVSATTETVANRNACHAITIQYFEVLRHFKINYHLAEVRECLFIPLPMKSFDHDTALRWRSVLERFVPTQDLVSGFSACDRLKNLTAEYASNRECDEAIEEIRGEAVFTYNMPMPAAYLTSPAFQPIPEYPLLNSFAAQLAPMWSKSQEERLSYFKEAIVPMLLRAIIDGFELGVDQQGAPSRSLPHRGSIASEYGVAGETRIRVDILGDVLPMQLTRASIDAIWLKIAQNLPPEWRIDLVGLNLRYATKFFRSTIVNQEMPAGRLRWQVDAGSQNLRITTPMTRVEVGNPRKIDEGAAAALIEHLNGNVEFYHKLIWWHMDDDRRFAILDGFLAPNAGGRSVASVVENRLAGIVGNSLVMPISPGVQLDNFDEIRKFQSNEDDNEDALLAAYRPSIANPASRISIPTKGVFAESVLGSCNACEEIDDTRNWRYWEHPLPDQPTEIEPVSVSSRRTDIPFSIPPVSDPNLKVQEPLKAPDPGVLLQQLATALVNLTATKDYTGLVGTQANARDALQGSFETTQKAYEIASNVLMKGIQAAASAYTGVPMADAEKIKASVGKDVRAGRMTPEQGQSKIAKINDVLTEQLGNGNFKSLLEQPEVSAALGYAAEKGAAMRLERGDTKVELGQAPPSVGRKSLLGWLFGPTVAEASVRPRSSGPIFSGLRFATLVGNYPRPGPPEHVGQSALFRKLGGQWLRKIGDPIEETKFRNTCALRLSYALNASGFPVPTKFREFQDGRGDTLISSVGRMGKALPDMFGEPSWTVSKPGAPIELPKGNGIMLILGKMGDANGHVDLWNGEKKAFAGVGQMAMVYACESAYFWPID